MVPVSRKAMALVRLMSGVWLMLPGSSSRMSAKLVGWRCDMASRSMREPEVRLLLWVAVTTTSLSVRSSGVSDMVSVVSEVRSRSVCHVR